MRKTILFHVLFESKNTKHNLTAEVTFNFLTSKSKVIKYFYKWVLQHQKEIEEKEKYKVMISNLKIIGL